MSEEVSRRARSLVESLPEEARVIGLVAASPADPAAHAAAAAVARATEGRRAGLLANLAGPGCGLDAHLGVARTEGFEAILGEGRRLGHVTVRPDGLGLLYLPGGASPVSSSGPETDGRSRLRPEVERALRRLAERLRAAGAIFLLYLPAELLGDPVLEEVLDGVILLDEAPYGSPHGSADGSPDESAGGETGLPMLGRLAPTGEARSSEPGESRSSEPGAARSSEPGGTAAVEFAGGPAADSGAGPGAEAGEEGGWRRRRREADFPAARVVVGAALVAFLFGGWWLLSSRAATGDGSGGETRPTAETPSARPGNAGSPEVEPPGGPSPGAVLAEARELGYSVLVASYSRLEVASDRVERWRGDGVPYLIAPTRVDGGVYHRVYAGAVATPDAGRLLMRRLVETGRKEEARGWDVRPTRLAFRLGVFRDRDRADSGLASVREGGVPAYRVEAAVGGDTVHALYAGAYEAEADASPLRRILRDAGVDAELVLRRGSSLTP